MLESHNSLSTGLLWLLLSRGFRMGGGRRGPMTSAVWRWDQPCRTFCLRCILRKLWATKVLMILNWSIDGAAISDQFSVYQVLIKFQDDYDNVCVWNFVNAKCVFSFLESNVFKWFCPPTYLIPLFEGGSWIVTREFNWNPHRYCHEYTIIFREGAYLLE